MKRRLFVGISIPEELVAEFSSIAEKMPFPYWNWTKPTNYHITACFIGQADEEETELINQKLACLSQPPFSLITHKIEPVTRKGRVDMIWATFLPSLDFANFSKAIHETLGIRLEREPLPHVTLCRVKAMSTTVVKAEDFPPLENKHVEVTSFSLYESASQGHGPTYYPLVRWALKP